MNKKLLIAIISAVVALAIIAVGAVLIVKSFKAKDNGDSSDGSSALVSSGESSNVTSSDQQETETIKKGGVNLPQVKAKSGEIVEVPIKITENPGIFAGQFQFIFDSNALEYVDYEKGDILDEYEVVPSDGEINCIITGNQMKDNQYVDSTKNGTVITFKFKVKSDAKKGDYTIKLGEKTMLCNIDEKVVSPKIGEGKITVK